MEQTIITRIGHATVLIQLPHITILTDPVFFDRIGISLFGLTTVGPKRLHKAAISINDLPPIDLVLISHAHFDHLDVQSLRAITHKQPYKIECITAFNTKKRLKNLQRKEVYELDWDQEIDILWLHISAGETRHRWARYPWTPDRSQESTMGAWHNSYLIEYSQNWSEKQIVFGGDTAYTHAFKKRHNKSVDVAIMPIGAYDPFRFQHCTPEEALKMADDMHSKVFIPVHRNTFRLSREKPLEPIERLEKALPQHTMILGIDRIGWVYTISDK